MKDYKIINRAKRTYNYAIWDAEKPTNDQLMSLLQKAKAELIHMEELRSELKKTKIDLKYQQHRNSLLFEEIVAKTKTIESFEKSKVQEIQNIPKYIDKLIVEAQELQEKDRRHRKTLTKDVKTGKWI